MHALPIGLLCFTLLLSGCGGADTTRSVEKADTCELPLKHADGLNSGIRIDPEASAVPRNFNTCAIQQLQSAMVSLCLDHQNLSELSAQLIFPNQTPLILDIKNASRGSSCLITGQLFTWPLPVQRLQDFKALRGDWSVKVRDNDAVANTPMGYLIGWSMRAEGLQ